MLLHGKLRHPYSPHREMCDVVVRKTVRYEILSVPEHEKKHSLGFNDTAYLEIDGPIVVSQDPQEDIETYPGGPKIKMYVPPPEPDKVTHQIVCTVRQKSIYNAATVVAEIVGGKLYLTIQSPDNMYETEEVSRKEPKQ